MVSLFNESPPADRERERERDRGEFLRYPFETGVLESGILDEKSRNGDTSLLRPRGLVANDQFYLRANKVLHCHVNSKFLVLHFCYISM